jgi:hypothetical protein
MSFYFDDAGGDDVSHSQNNICPACKGTTFYDDPVSGIPTCASCYHQSQTATQEEFGEDDAYALSGGSITRSHTSKGKGSLKKGRGRTRKPLREYDRSQKLPDEKDCCDAFEWLLYDAAKCVAKLVDLEDEEEVESFEQTVKEIWTTYRTKWKEAANIYSKKYPECRFAFRDFFLQNNRKAHLMRHLSLSVGKRVEEEMIQEMQMKLFRDMDDDEFYNSATASPPPPLPPVATHNDNNEGGGEKPNSVSLSKQSSGGGTSGGRSTTKHQPPRKKMRRSVVTVADLVKDGFPHSWKKNTVRYPNGIYEQHPYHAVVKIYPSLSLLLSILQLALIDANVGIAPYHLTKFVANGLLNHALNGYMLLPPNMKRRVGMVKDFFITSYIPPPNEIQDLADLLATATDWYGSDEHVDGICLKIDPEECLYNVKRLVRRMVRDFGFESQVLANVLALMGDKSYDSSTQSAVGIPVKLKYAKKLFTPLHVAAMIVVACKFCPEWESWNINGICSRSMKANGETVVPWSESEFQSLNNGRQIDHYLDFLGYTAFSQIDAPSENVSNFFETLEEDVPTTSFSWKELSFTKEDEKQDQKKKDDSRNATPSEEEDTPTTEEILQAVDNFYRQSDKDKTSVKTLIRSVSSHFGLSTVSKELRSKIKDRIVLLNSQFDYIATHEVKRYKQKRFRSEHHDKLNVVTRESSHPQYCMLLEYICFVMEEPDVYKLHDLVAEIEDELFPSKIKKKWVCKFEGCTTTARGGGFCTMHGGKKKSVSLAVKKDKI